MINTSTQNKTPRRIAQPRILFEAGLALLAIVLAVALWAQSRPESVSTAATNASQAGLKAARQDAQAPLAKTVSMNSQAQQNIGLRAEPAQIRNVVQTIRTIGTVGPNETRLGHIRALTRGRILSINVQLGDRVRAAQPLAVYDNIELGEVAGQYGVGLAGLKKAQAEAEVSRQSMDRAKGLVELGAVAQAELDRRNAEYAYALSSIESQKAELAQLTEKMHRFGLDDAEIQQITRSDTSRRSEKVSRTTLRAPFSGIVTARNVVEGETVETATELFTIADLSTVWVQADIYEKDIGSIRKGVMANVSVDAYPGQTFQGRITYISNTLDPKTRTAKVRAEVLNQDGRLKLDMFATIDIPTPEGRKAVMIPATAVQQIDNQPLVFVRSGGTEFLRRPLQLGAKNGDWVEAVSGVKPGENVVTDGSFQLKSLLLREQIGEKE